MMIILELLGRWKNNYLSSSNTSLSISLKCFSLQMSEEKIKKTCIKFHAFNEFPMSELIKIEKAMNELGYEGTLVSNGNVSYCKES